METSAKVVTVFAIYVVGDCH